MAIRSLGAFAAATALLALACDHGTKVKLQDHILAPQRNYTASAALRDDLLALPIGTTQDATLTRFGLPKLVHVEGPVCSPWDACTYDRSRLVYHTHESATCYLDFSSAKLDRKVTCDPYRQDLVLGAGDIDPHTGVVGPNTIVKP